MTRTQTIRRAAVCTAAALLVLVLGVVDYFTGPEVGFRLFYLVPVAAGGWYLGRAPAAALAVLAAIVWHVAAHEARPDAPLGVALWNTNTRLFVYVAIGLLLAGLRHERDQLRAMTTHFRTLADREATLARTDAMTGLANTRAFLEQLRIEASRARRSQSPLCVAYINLDNFKRVNDVHGHAAGDELLGRIADILRSATRGGDFVARLGGDEFAVLFHDVPREAAEPVVARIIDRIAELGGSYPGTDLGASAGIAYASSPPEVVEEVLRLADDAMYAAKALGKGKLVVRDGVEAALPSAADRQSPEPRGVASAPARPEEAARMEWKPLRRFPT